MSASHYTTPPPEAFLSSSCLLSDEDHVPIPEEVPVVALDTTNLPPAQLAAYPQQLHSFHPVISQPQEMFLSDLLNAYTPSTPFVPLPEPLVVVTQSLRSISPDWSHFPPHQWHQWRPSYSRSCSPVRQHQRNPYEYIKEGEDGVVRRRQKWSVLPRIRCSLSAYLMGYGAQGMITTSSGCPIGPLCP